MTNQTPVFEPAQHLWPALRGYFVLAIIAAWLGGVYLVSAGDYPAWFACPFLEMTGLYCPGCGSTRSTHALLHGNLGASARYNVMVLLLGVPAAGWLIVRSCRDIRGHSAGERALPGWLGWGVLTVVLVFWVSRNLPISALEWSRPPSAAAEKEWENQS